MTVKSKKNQINLELSKHLTTSLCPSHDDRKQWWLSIFTVWVPVRRN